MTMDSGDGSESIGIANHKIKIDSVVDNTSQNLIYTTEDKLELCINDYKKELDKQYSVGTPFAAALTLWITVFTVEFRPVLEMPAATVKTIFWLSAGLTTIWLGYSIVNWRRKSGTTPTDFINLVKSRSSKPTTPG